jgi:hypothetical protein
MDDDASHEAAKAGVPADISRTSSFRRWHQAQHDAGNRLEGAEVLWSFRAEDGVADFWAMRVAVHVGAEDRIKANEVVISRPDASVVALYRRAALLDESVVVLVREFRSAARTDDGFAHELPGGSGPARDPAMQAATELEEEFGFALDSRRLQDHGSRQAVASQSTHHVRLYSAQITDAELDALRAQTGPHGTGLSERTWVEVSTFGAIRRERSVDWATLGLLAQTLLDR